MPSADGESSTDVIQGVATVLREAQAALARLGAGLPANRHESRQGDAAASGLASAAAALSKVAAALQPASAPSTLPDDDDDDPLRVGDQVNELDDSPTRISEFLSQNDLEPWVGDALGMLSSSQRSAIIEPPMKMDRARNPNGIVVSRMKQVVDVHDRAKMFVRINDLADAVEDRISTLSGDQLEAMMESGMKIQKANNPSGVAMKRINDVLRTFRQNGKGDGGGRKGGGRKGDGREGDSREARLVSRHDTVERRWRGDGGSKGKGFGPNGPGFGPNGPGGGRGARRSYSRSRSRSRSRWDGGGRQEQWPQRPAASGGRSSGPPARASRGRGGPAHGGRRDDSREPSRGRERRGGGGGGGEAQAKFPPDIQELIDDMHVERWCGEVLRCLSLYQRQSVIREIGTMTGVRNPTGVVMSRVRHIASPDELAAIFVRLNDLDRAVEAKLWELSVEQRQAVIAPGIYVQNVRNPSTAVGSRINNVLNGKDAMGRQTLSQAPQGSSRRDDDDDDDDGASSSNSRPRKYRRRR